MATDTVVPDTITIPQLAKRLGLSEAKAYELAQANDYPFPIIRIGGRVMVSRHAYEAWLDQYNYKGGNSESDDHQDV